MNVYAAVPHRRNWNNRAPSEGPGVCQLAFAQTLSPHFISGPGFRALMMTESIPSVASCVGSRVMSSNPAASSSAILAVGERSGDASNPVASFSALQLERGSRWRLCR